LVVHLQPGIKTSPLSLVFAPFFHSKQLAASISLVPSGARRSPWAFWQVNFRCDLFRFALQRRAESAWLTGVLVATKFPPLYPFLSPHFGRLRFSHPHVFCREHDTFAKVVTFGQLRPSSTPTQMYPTFSPTFSSPMMLFSIVTWSPLSVPSFPLSDLRFLRSIARFPPNTFF